MNIFERTIYKISEPLSPEAVDKIAEGLEAYLKEEGKLEDKLALKLRLVIDTVLVHYLEHDCTGRVVTLKVYKKLAQRYLRLEVTGLGSNPLQQDSDEQISSALGFTSFVLSQVDIVPQYSYNKFVNRIVIALPTKPINPMVLTVFGIGAAVLTYAVCNAFLTPSTTQILLKDIIEPLFRSVMGLLNLSAMLMIFFSLASSLCNVADSAALERFGTVTLRRILCKNFVVSIVSCLGVSMILGIVSLSSVKISFELGKNIYLMILNIIPNNVVDPFRQGEALQITFLAVVSGIFLFGIKERCCSLVKIVDDLAIFTMDAVSKICKLMPLIVYLSFTQFLLGERQISFTSVVVLPITALILILIYLTATMVEFTHKTKTPLVPYFKQMWPATLLSFCTASSISCYTQVEAVCAKYKVRSAVQSFVLPLAQILYRPNTVIQYVAAIIPMLYVYGQSLTLPQMCMFIITAFLMAVAAPTTSGGAMAMYALLTKQVGLPAEALSIILAMDIITDMMGTSCKITLTPAETIMIDREIGK